MKINQNFLIKGDDEDENPQVLDPNDPSNYILPPEMAKQDDYEPETETAMETDQEDQSGLAEKQKNMIPIEVCI